MLWESARTTGLRPGRVAPRMLQALMFGRGRGAVVPSRPPAPRTETADPSESVSGTNEASDGKDVEPDLGRGTVVHGFSKFAYNRCTTHYKRKKTYAIKL